MKSSAPSQNKISFSPRQAAWACIRPETELREVQKEFRTAISQVSTEMAAAIQLAQDFRVMIEQKQGDQLNSWLNRAEESEMVEFRRFAESLRSDYRAVKAALTFSWSNDYIAYCTSSLQW
jgi:transposase